MSNVGENVLNIATPNGAAIIHSHGPGKTARGGNRTNMATLAFRGPDRLPVVYHPTPLAPPVGGQAWSSRFRRPCTVPPRM